MKVLKDTAVYTVGNLLPKAAAFFLLPIYTRCMTTEDYGIVSLLAVLSFVLSILFSLAIERSMYRLYHDHKTVDEKKAYMGTLFISLLLVSSVMLLVVVFPLKSVVFSLIKGIPSEKFFFATVAASYLTIFGLIPMTYFRVELKPWRFLRFSLGEFVLITVAILYFVVFRQMGAWGMVLGSLVAKGIMTLVYLLTLIRIVHFRFNPKIFKESLKFSLPVIPGLLSGWIIIGVDRIFIERFYGMSEVGIYSLGYKMASLILLFLGAFSQAYSPYFYKEASSSDQASAKKRLWVYNNAFMAVAIFAACGLSVLAKDLVQIVFDERFWSAYLIVPVVAFGCMLNQTGGILHFSAYQEKKTMPIVWVLMMTAVLNVALNGWFIPVFGAMGAAWATLLSFLIAFIVKYIVVRRYYFIPMNFKLLIPILLLSVAGVYAAGYISCSLWLSLLIKSGLLMVLGGIFSLWGLKCLFPFGHRQGLQELVKQDL